MRVQITVAALVLGLAAPVWAQVKYVDEHGVAHWVQKEDMVPERYRGAATRPSLPRVPSGGDSTFKVPPRAESDAEQSARPAARRSPREATQDEKDLAEWQRNQAGIAAAKQAAFDKKVERRCNSVRSDSATPGLIAQCQELYNR